MKKHCVWVYKRIVWALKMWKTGWRWRNSVWLLIYSIVRRRHKENPDQVNGDFWWFVRPSNNISVSAFWFVAIKLSVRSCHNYVISAGPFGYSFDLSLLPQNALPKVPIVRESWWHIGKSSVLDLKVQGSKMY